MVKPLLHQMLLVSWLLTLFQRQNPLENQFDDDSVELAASAVNSSVIDDTDEPGLRGQCSMPSTSSSHDRKRTAAPTGAHRLDESERKRRTNPLSGKRI